MVDKDLTDEERFRPISNHVTIQFDTQAEAERFLQWLSTRGERNYQDWQIWMKDYEEDGPTKGLPVVSFDYHNPGQGVVTATCGRMDRDE